MRKDSVACRPTIDSRATPLPRRQEDEIPPENTAKRRRANASRRARWQTVIARRIGPRPRSPQPRHQRTAHDRNAGRARREEGRPRARRGIRNTMSDDRINHRIMRRPFLIGTVLLAGVMAALAQGVSGDAFAADASFTFSIFASHAHYGFLGGKSAFESLVRKDHLTRKDGGEHLGAWWSLWEGNNATGRVTVYGAFPDLTDMTRDHFFVRFEPPAETPMPQALLSHLLEKAKETTVSGGDTLDLNLPSESFLGGCTERFTLRIRLTTGALVSNTVEDFCPIK